MEFKGKGHVYECIPSVLNIKADYDAYLENVELSKNAGEEAPEEVKPVIIKLVGVSQPEWDKQKATELEYASTYEITERLQKVSELSIDQLKKHFKGVEGLVVAGKPVESFEDFYENAPAELVQWALMAIFSTEMLTAAELKN